MSDHGNTATSTGGLYYEKQKGGDVRKKMVKEIYCKPEIRSEEIEVGVYGEYPIAQMQPWFGLCPPCNSGP